MEMDARPVALAPFEVGNLIEREMALHRANPAALRQDHGDWLLLDHRRPVDVTSRRHLIDSGPALVAELVLYPVQVALDPSALPSGAFDQLCEFVTLPPECL